MGKKYQIKTGERFGNLTVISESERHRRESGRPERTVKCLCDCGNVVIKKLQLLIIGNTTSCGCFHRNMMKQKMTKHGMKGEPEYLTWKRMKYRCYNPKSKAYECYGGRGIIVCDKWKNDFLAFFNDIGKKPSPEYSIDRINVDGNYEPGNVRWATSKQQANNRRK